MGCLRTGASAKKNEKFVAKTNREIWNKVKDNGPVLQKCGERYCYACYVGKKIICDIHGKNYVLYVYESWYN